MKEVSLSLPQVRPPSRCAGGRFPGELDARATSDRNLIIAPLLIIMILKKYSSALLLRPSSSASRLLYSTMLKPRSPGEYSGNWTPTSKGKQANSTRFLRPSHSQRRPDQPGHQIDQRISHRYDPQPDTQRARQIYNFAKRSQAQDMSGNPE